MIRHRIDAVNHESFRRDAYCGRITEEEYQRNRQIQRRSNATSAHVEGPTLANDRQRSDDRLSYIGIPALDNEEHERCRNSRDNMQITWIDDNRYAQYVRRQRRFQSSRVNRTSDDNASYIPIDDYHY